MKRLVCILLVFLLAGTVSCTRVADTTGGTTSSVEGHTSMNGDTTTPYYKEKEEEETEAPIIIKEDTLVLVQNNISGYKIIYPKDASEAVMTAVSELQGYIKKISGVMIPAESDESESGELEIAVGYTNRSADGQFDIEKLGADGFVIETVGKKLFIAGSGQRGALYGVYGFLEKYLGCGFYTSEYEKIPSRDTVAVQQIERDEQIPAFEYREIDFVTSRKNNFQAKLRANGVYAPSSAKTGGRIEYVGGFVHTLEHFVSQNDYFESHPEYFAMKEDGTRQKGWGAQLCLSNPDVLAIVKEKVRALLRDRPDANIISVSQSDSGTNVMPCMCPECRRVHEEEGSYSGTLIRFVNAVANEFAFEYPNVKFDTLAYRYSRKVCKTPPADNVIVRLCTIECCFSHPLGECKDVYAVSGSDNSIAEDIADWGRICKNVYVWDYVTNYKQSVIFFPNFNSMRQNVRFFAEHGVNGVYEEANYFSETCDFPELRSYILSKLLWDPYMSEEDYRGYIDDFLKNVYGKGWRKIREYIDLAQSMVKDVHFGIYEPFISSVFSYKVNPKKDSGMLASLTLDKIKNYTETDWSAFEGYSLSVTESELVSKGTELFNAALAVATEEQAYRIRKAMLQIEFLRSYSMHATKSKNAITDNIITLLSDFFRSTEEGRPVSSSEKNKLIFAVRDYVSENYGGEYASFNKALYEEAQGYGIARLGEGSPDISGADVDFDRLPYDWK